MRTVWRCIRWGAREDERALFPNLFVGCKRNNAHIFTMMLRLLHSPRLDFEKIIGFTSSRQLFSPPSLLGATSIGSLCF